MVSTSHSDSDNLSSIHNRTFFIRQRDRCKKGQSRLFPTVQPSLLELMHCVADGLGYLVLVSYSTQYVITPGCRRVLYMFVANRYFFKSPSLSLQSMSVCIHPQIHPRDTISCKQPTISNEHFCIGEHNPVDVKTIIDVNTTTLSILFKTKHSLVFCSV